MYRITSNESREQRVTNYVKEQARNWLYQKIAARELSGNSNTTRNLLISILQEGTLSAEKYDLLCSYMMQSPYGYIINKKKLKGKDIITTKLIENYLVLLNGECLPAGFIIAFYEDDYELAREVEEFYSEYLNDSMNEFVINYSKQRNMNEKAIEDIKADNASLLKGKFSEHFVNIFIRMFLPLLAFSICLISVVVNWIEYPSVTETLMIYGIGALLTLIPYINAIRLIVFYSRWLDIKLHIEKTSKICGVSNEDFSANATQALSEDLAEINATLINETELQIEDSCKVRAKNKKDYLRVFNFKNKNLTELIQRLRTTYAKKVNLAGAKKNGFLTFVGMLNCYFWIYIHCAMWFGLPPFSF